MFMRGIPSDGLTTSVCVMAGLARPPTTAVPDAAKSWVTGPSPVMTQKGNRQLFKRQPIVSSPDSIFKDQHPHAIDTTRRRHRRAHS